MKLRKGDFVKTDHGMVKIEEKEHDYYLGTLEKTIKVKGKPCNQVYLTEVTKYKIIGFVEWDENGRQKLC